MINTNEEIYSDNEFFDNEILQERNNSQLKSASISPILRNMYCEYLNALNIHVLRNLARHYGVEQPTIKLKNILIEYIIDIIEGIREPVERSARGAPVKERNIDSEIFTDLKCIREKFDDALQSGDLLEGDFHYNMMGVGQSGAVFGDYEVEDIHHGFLVYSSSNAYIKRDITKDFSLDNVYVSKQQVKAFKLKEGDYIVCTKFPSGTNLYSSLNKIISVCEVRVKEYEKRKDFSSLLSIYPSKKINLGTDNPVFNAISEFCPMGMGQRALMIAPRKVDKYRFISSFANAILKNNPQIKMFAAILDGREEDTVELKKDLNDCDCVSAGFDAFPDKKAVLADLTLLKAVRYAELGRDSVVILDGINSYARACSFVAEAGKKELTEEIDYTALLSLKKYLATAKNTTEAGSVTIIAIADEAKRKTEEVLLEEISEVCNSLIVLKKDTIGGISKVDLYNSYTIKADRFAGELLSDKLKELNEKIPEEEIYAHANSLNELQKFLKVKAKNI